MSFYNSYLSQCKTPFGAVKSGEEMVFQLRIPKNIGCTEPRLCIAKAGEQPQYLLFARNGETETDALFLLRCPAPAPGTYFYYFDLWVNFTKIFRDENNEGVLGWEDGAKWQLTVYDPAFTTPAPLRGGVMYQIFPDRFAEGHKNKLMPFADRFARPDKNGEPFFWPNEQKDGLLNMDYYGGDFLGIQQKLPYLAGLGVTCIYLNPIFEAHSNHRYNTADYLKPDPLLGTIEEFEQLCAAAKAKNISIILDGVFSHTGSDSVYFDREGRYGSDGAYHNPLSRYRSWYDFSPKYPSGYRCWWGFETLPEVNERDLSYRRFICGEGGVIDYWLKHGASGFRLDVADELPDDFIEEIRRTIKRHGEDKLLLGEVWEDATNKESYGVHRTYLLGRGLDTVMNYPFKDAVLRFLRSGNAGVLQREVLSIVEHYPKPAMDVAMNFISTHDTVRAVTALAGEDCANHDRYWQSGRMLSAGALAWGKKMMALAYCLIFTLPGVPCVYYGDEIAMQGYRDPFNRAFFNWDSRDETLRNVIRRLSALRRSCPALADGTLLFHEAAGDVLCYERRSGSSRVLVLVNRSQRPVTRSIGGTLISAGPQNFAFEVKNQTDNLTSI